MSTGRSDLKRCVFESRVTTRTYNPIYKPLIEHALPKTTDKTIFIVAMYGKKIIGSNPVAMYGSSTSTIKRAGSQIRNSYAPHKRTRLNDDPSVFESSGRSQTSDSRLMPPPNIDRYVTSHHNTDSLYQAPSATPYRIGVLKEKVNVQQSKTLAKADFTPGMIIRCALHGMYKFSPSSSNTPGGP